MKPYRLLIVAVLFIVLSACGGGGTTPQGDDGNGDGNGQGDEAPEILDMGDLDGATDVPVDGVFKYTFDKAIDPTTVTTTSFFIMPVVDDVFVSISKSDGEAGSPVCDPGLAVPATVECEGDSTCEDESAEGSASCTLTPDEDLDAGTEYVACVTPDVTDACGDSVEAAAAEIVTEEPAEPEPEPECTSNADCADVEDLPTCDTGEGVCVEANYLTMHIASVSSGPNYVHLTWNPPSETGGPPDEGVIIRRLEGETCPEADEGEEVYSGSKQAFSDTTATGEVVYCYRIWYNVDGVATDPDGGGITTGTAYVDIGPAAILWQNQSTGKLYEWRLGMKTDDYIKSSSYVDNLYVSPVSWQIKGLIDLDAADEPTIEEYTMRTKDIVWQRTTTGGLYYWLMNPDGTRKTGPGESGMITNNGSPITLSSAWQVVGLAQLNPNQDSYGDIMFHNTNTGVLYRWLLEKTDDGVSILQTCDEDGHNPGCEECTHSCSGRVHSSAVSGASWSIVKVGNLIDAKNDSNAEILFRNKSTGAILLWELDDEGVYSSNTTVSNSLSTNWRIEMVEDIDRDPNQNMDILFRNTSTGLVRIWFLNESAEIENNVQVSDSVVSVSSWSVVGIARVGYNTARDIIWRNTSNGRLVGWQLGSDGVRYGSYTIINSVSSNLQIKAMTEY